jgi:hypothetical protein
MASYELTVQDSVTANDTRSRVTVDATPPVLTPIYPAAGAADVPPDVVIAFDVQDFITGVDFPNLEIYVNTVLIFESEAAVTDWTITFLPIANGYRFYLTPPVGFEYESVVSVRVVAYDKA